MSSIHYFQRYSQKENATTNNTLLLFSRLYFFSPTRFEGFLKEILEDAPIVVGVSFEQQIRSKNSVPDASFYQKSFRVLIETKLYQNFSEKQLHKHLIEFNNDDNNILNVLLHISPSLPPTEFVNNIKEAVREYEIKNSINIKFICTTFEKIISTFESVILENDFEMKEIIEDFKEYCAHDELLPKENYLMRALTCGWTLDENFEFGLYYDPIYRGYQNHKYIGIYSQKSVRGIGEIENIISASLTNGKLIVLDSLSEVTKQQEARIKGVIKKAKENNNWDLAGGHKYFLVKKFHETNYRKRTPYPIQRAKYFNLSEILDMKSLPPVEEIAELLRSKEW